MTASSRIERVRQASMLAGRSQLSRWMQQHHDTLTAAFAEAGRPNWKAIAAELTADGMTDAEGKPLSPERVRQTWFHVRKRVRSKPRPTPAPAQALLPVASGVPPSRVEWAKPDDPQRIRFKPVALKGSSR